jgi:hypothetical protein
MPEGRGFTAAPVTASAESPGPSGRRGILLSGSEMSQIAIIEDLDEVPVEMELVGDLVGQSKRKQQQLSGTIGVKTP